jgi:hypothetical protein
VITPAQPGVPRSGKCHQVACRFNGTRVGVLWNHRAKGAKQLVLRIRRPTVVNCYIQPYVCDCFVCHCCDFYTVVLTQLRKAYSAPIVSAPVVFRARGRHFLRAFLQPALRRGKGVRGVKTMVPLVGDRQILRLESYGRR